MTLAYDTSYEKSVVKVPMRRHPLHGRSESRDQDKWAWSCDKFGDGKVKVIAAARAAKVFDPPKQQQATQQGTLKGFFSPFRAPRPKPEATTPPLFGSLPAAPMDVEVSPAAEPPAQQPSTSQEAAAPPAAASSAFCGTPANEGETTAEQRAAATERSPQVASPDEPAAKRSNTTASLPPSKVSIRLRTGA